MAEKFYVKRTDPDNGSTGWIGPIKGHQRAEIERKSWAECGWTAEIHEATPELHSVVLAWKRARRTCA